MGSSNSFTSSYQSDWAPPIVPALWQRTAVRDGHPPPKPMPEPQAHPGPIVQAPSWDSHAQAPPPIHRSGGSGQPASSQSTQPQAPSWISQVQAPLPVYRSHPQSDPGTTARSLGGGNYEAWLADARTRADRFRLSGPSAPTTWLLHEGDDAPPSSLLAPSNHGSVHIRRRYHEGKMWVGSHFPQVPHEVLVGDHRAVKWVKCQGQMGEMKERLVEGGRNDDGKVVYVGVTERGGETIVGRVTIGESS
jgi:hypothetical protein